MFLSPTRFMLALAVGAAAHLGAMSGPAAAAPASKRLALVIGNSAYTSIQALTNPKNDATDIAAKLKTLKFDVLLATDASRAEMATLLTDFTARITQEHVALVFFAGHGVAINQQSFLLPVDVPGVIEADEQGMLRPAAVKSHLVDLADMLTPLDKAKLGIVFLDACRTDQVKPGVGLTLRVAALAPGRQAPKLLRGTGSVEIKASPHSAGVFRAYATQLDNVALDGSGRNSPFTKALLKHIGTKGISIQEMMVRVRKAVIEETNREQVPWSEEALTESFAFVDAPAVTVPRGPSGPPANVPAVKAPAAPKGNTPSVGVGF